MKAADNGFIFRSGIKEMAHQHGFKASFMTCPDSKTPASGGHFNHSLWKIPNSDTDTDAEAASNVFRDERSKDKLSQLCKWWIGGILKHMSALTAFANLTVSMYAVHT